MSFRTCQALLAFLPLVHPLLLAQEPARPPAATLRTDTVSSEPAWKSPISAALLGLVFPGSGHWYAREGGRGTVVAAIYWAGVAVVAGGRSDRIGNVGGVALLGALSFSVIDGARAAKRFNHRTAQSSPGAAGLIGQP